MDKTIVRRYFVSGRINEKIYDYDSNASDYVMECAHLARLREEHPDWNWDRKRKTEEELLELLNQGEMTEEEIEKLYEERLRKAALSVKRNIESCINSRPFYYFVTFTSNISTIFSNPFRLIKLVNKYLRKQKIDFVIVLEPFFDIAKGWHVHGITSAPVDFAEWLDKYGANTDEGVELGENYSFDAAYLNAHNLYCEPIRTNDEACFKYMIKKIEDCSYRILKEMYPDENIRMFYSSVNVPSGSEIGCRVNGNEYWTYKNPISKYRDEYEKETEELLMKLLEGYYIDTIYEVHSRLLGFIIDRYFPLFEKKKDLEDKERKLFKYVRATLIDLACTYEKKYVVFLEDAISKVRDVLLGRRIHEIDEVNRKYERYPKLKKRLVNDIIDEIYDYDVEPIYKDLEKIYKIAIKRVEEEEFYVEDKKQRELEQQENKDNSETIEKATSSFTRPIKVKNIIQEFEPVLKLVTLQKSLFLGLTYLIKYVIFIKNIP